MGPLVWVSGAVFVGFQLWLLPTLTDWVSSAVDEGFVSYAAQRIREGAWPHRDFFYLWTPGTPVLHALLQAAGLSWVGERAAALVAHLATAWLVLLFARDWRLPRPAVALLAALLAAWSFSLWNIPYASWYAVFLALLAVRMLPRSLAAAALLFALSFWFKQNVGIFSLLGSLAWLTTLGRPRDALRLAAVFLAGLAVPFAGIGLIGGRAALANALWQIFLFPLRYPGLMGLGLGSGLLAAPLTTLGLWILSLLFLGAGGRAARWTQLAVLAFAAAHLMGPPESFLFGCFAVFSFAAWPLSLLLILTEKNTESRARLLGVWLPGLGAFCQVYPRLDFQHFLFVFPIVALLLTLSTVRLVGRYPKLSPAWAALPALLLVAGGIARQSTVVTTRLEGHRDSLGRVSAGAGRRLDEEVTAVARYLRERGLRDGDPILVLPNATNVYAWTGFRDPTPHLQFFPGYVEAHGDEQDSVLAAFRAAGGRFLVVQERSGLAEDVPEIWRGIQAEYRVVQRFPEHFTIYEPASGQSGMPAQVPNR